MSEKRESRFRNFVTVCYPESMPDDWEQVVTDWHVPVLVSPLHDKDINPDGEIKKPHYHVMLLFDNVKTIEQAKALISEINGVGCEVVKSTRGQARYFLHLDNPEKAQYDVKDVRTFAGVDYQVLISLPSDRYSIIREILEFIEANDIMSFNALYLWTSKNKEDWFRAISDNCAYIVKEYIASRQYSLEHNLTPITSKWTLPEKEVNNE